MRGGGRKQSDPAEPQFPHLEGAPKRLRPAQIRYSANRAVRGEERPLSLYKAAAKSRQSCPTLCDPTEATM